MRFATFFLTAVLAFLSVRTWADPASVVSQVDAPGATTYTDAVGINKRGEIVGSFTDARPLVHGYVFRNGAFTALEVPGVHTVPLGINDGGDIVGFGVTNGSEIHGLLWNKGGDPTQIDAPDADITYFHGINNRGQIVGHSREDIFALARAFLWQDGNFTFLDIPGVLLAGRGRESMGINDRGQVVGTCQIQGVNHGFLIDHGDVTLIDVPGATATYVSGINNRGEIVGTYSDADSVGHGYLRNAKGAITRIEASNATGIEPVRLNDRGDIVGMFSESGQVHGFLFTQSPSLIALNRH
ncbi:MAG TPA: hypothetical protein VGF24_30725 [Vicinamibacterales bacterium]|jgi:probable HAF family extracellular repeat protein